MRATTLLMPAPYLGGPEGPHYKGKYNPRRRNPVRFRLIFAALALAGFVVGIRAQKPPDGDWPMYARDLAGTKFSPLKQINADNVGKLQPAWNLNLVEPRTPSNPPNPSNPEVTPIV